MKNAGTQLHQPLFQGFLATRCVWYGKVQTEDTLLQRVLLGGAGLKHRHERPPHRGLRVSEITCVKHWPQWPTHRKPSVIIHSE